MEQKNIGPDKALEKIRHFCSYQERSHQEVKDKLYGFGLYRNQVETLLSQMIEENYLNEERYAIAYAGGKFRVNHWGRVKIRHALKQKQVSDYCIKVALNAIDEDEYLQALEKQFNTKFISLRTERNKQVKKQKLYAYLLQKGYESQLISELMHKM